MGSVTSAQRVLGWIEKQAEQEVGSKQATKQHSYIAFTSVPALGSRVTPCPDSLYGEL